VTHAGRGIKFETCAEIIAKKMWHRGHQAKARDLYDLCAVAEPDAIQLSAPFFCKYGAAFLQRLHERAEFVEAEFNAIDSVGFQRPFSECLAQAHSIIAPILAKLGR
jgi:menaquinone-dependent protoporphyrinogen IX oxidase